jgi:hypothetical protein
MWWTRLGERKAGGAAGRGWDQVSLGEHRVTADVEESWWADM